MNSKSRCSSLAELISLSTFSSFLIQLVSASWSRAACARRASSITAKNVPLFPPACDELLSQCARKLSQIRE